MIAIPFFQPLDMRRRAPGAALILAIFLTVSFPRLANAHGDLHERIVKVTRQIEQSPNRADLYFLRGELRHFHEEWDAALADFDQVLRLDPEKKVAHLARAITLLAAGQLLPARQSADRFLEAHPDHPEALLVRARALEKGGQPLAAAEDFSRAIARLPTADPDVYLERARALAAAGPEHLALAIQGLDEGMQRLGSIVTLELEAIELELKREHFDAALARVEAQAARVQRKETWLAHRGDILRQAGRYTEAQVAYRQALDAIEALSAGLRNVPVIARLRVRLQDAQYELSQPELKSFAGPPAGIHVETPPSTPPPHNNPTKNNPEQP